MLSRAVIASAAIAAIMASAGFASGAFAAEKGTSRSNLGTLHQNHNEGDNLTPGCQVGNWKNAPPCAENTRIRKGVSSPLAIPTYSRVPASSAFKRIEGNTDSQNEMPKIVGTS
jgi:hypothetical protein